MGTELSPLKELHRVLGMFASGAAFGPQMVPMALSAKWMPCCILHAQFPLLKAYEKLEDKLLLISH